MIRVRKETWSVRFVRYECSIFERKGGGGLFVSGKGFHLLVAIVDVFKL